MKVIVLSMAINGIMGIDGTKGFCDFNQDKMLKSG
jgi:hypothetical protein